MKSVFGIGNWNCVPGRYWSLWLILLILGVDKVRCAWWKLFGSLKTCPFGALSYFKRSVLFFPPPSVLLVTRSLFSVATVLFLWQPVSRSMFGRSDEAALHIRVWKLICKVSSRPFVLPFVCGCGPVTCSVSSAPGHEISSDIHFQGVFRSSLFTQSFTLELSLFVCSQSHCHFDALSSCPIFLL